MFSKKRYPIIQIERDGGYNNDPTRTKDAISVDERKKKERKKKKKKKKKPVKIKISEVTSKHRFSTFQKITLHKRNG